MRRAVLIANPAASWFTGALHRRVVAERATDFDVTVAWPHGADAARSVAAEAADDGVDVVVAMGGDGVVHHVANGLARSRSAMGIIPAGTTNVVARILGIPTKPAKAAALLATAKARPLPLAHLATDSPVAARSEYAVFAAGIGFDADMVLIADRRPTSKYHFGSVHYARSAAAALWTGYRKRPPNLRVECDGRRVDAVAVLVQVHDPFTYFGRMPLRLTDDPGPGLTVVAIESLAMRRAMAVLARSTRGRSLDAVAGVHVWHGPEKLIIEAEPSSRFQADGELLGSTDWLEVTPVPEALWVLTPPRDDEADGS
jgi:diacylglycerol kinase family enzyme